MVESAFTSMTLRPPDSGARRGRARDKYSEYRSSAMARTAPSQRSVNRNERAALHQAALLQAEFTQNLRVVERDLNPGRAPHHRPAGGGCDGLGQ